MFSSISSYIWGQEGAPEEGGEAVALPPSPLRDPSPSGEEWVLVGNQPAPGSLSGLDPLPPSSSNPSSASSEAGEDPEGQLGHSESTRVPIRAGHDASISLKNLRAAQLSRQKNTGKALSSKALKRGNKAVIPGKRREVGKYNMSIKAAGFNKNLKQC